MILQSLSEYYKRKSVDPDSALAPFGFKEENIPFVIVIKDDGEFIQLRDTRKSSEKEDKGQRFLVPQLQNRTGTQSYNIAHCLWDHIGYVLNQCTPDKLGGIPTEKDIQTAARRHASFKRQTEMIAKAIPEDNGAQAVKNFCARPEQIEAVKNDPEYQECLKIKGCKIAFQLAKGEESHALCCQSKKVQDYIKERAKMMEGSKESGTTQVAKKTTAKGKKERKNRPQFCLVSGRTEPIARLHKGISHIAPKGAPPLASVNIASAQSYRKEQGYNFPVGEQAAFEYTTALNHLLRPESRQKLYVAGTTIVCWSQKQNQLEEDLFDVLSGSSHDDPDDGRERVINYYKSLATGLKIPADNQQPFYVLGLAPNPPSRIVIRFWLTGTVAEFSQRIGQWFHDLELDGSQHAKPPSIYQLLRCTAPKKKEDKGLKEDDGLARYLRNLTAEVSLAILEGLPLPATLQASVIRRIRAEKGKVTHTRACLIKACLNRKYRYGKQSSQEEITVPLNKSETQPGYVLGRLFAVLEKIQRDAFKKDSPETEDSKKNTPEEPKKNTSKDTLNSTICDRYYSSASCTPKVVFGTLIGHSMHHMKKLENPGDRYTAKKRIGEIIDLLDSETRFPAHLNLHEQGLFAIGYFHQTQVLYQKKSPQEPQDDSSDASCA